MTSGPGLPLSGCVGPALDCYGKLSEKLYVLWASRYPHPDSVWPNSRQAIERQMRHLSPGLRRKLTHDNAAALLGLGAA